MGKAPHGRRGHRRPQAHDSRVDPGETSLLISSDPKERRVGHRQKSQGEAQ